MTLPVIEVASSKPEAVSLTAVGASLTAVMVTVRVFVAEAFGEPLSLTV